MLKEGTKHEQNVINLGVFITRVTLFGENYNPSRNELTISSLTNLKAKGEKIIEDLIKAEIACNNAQNERNLCFKNLDSLITRISSAVVICGTSEQIIEKTKSIVRNLRGQRSSEKNNLIELSKEKDTQGVVKQNSKHNTTISSKIENFNLLYQLVLSIPEYKPNEYELTTDGIYSKLQQIKSTYNCLIKAEAELNAMRSLRNKFLYENKNGLVYIASDSKMYVKSAFGVNSTQYKSISDIKFIKRSE